MTDGWWWWWCIGPFAERWAGPTAWAGDALDKGGMLCWLPWPHSSVASILGIFVAFATLFNAVSLVEPDKNAPTTA